MARGYELGHRALAEGLSLLEMALLYQDALASVLLPKLASAERTRVLKAAGEFFLETLAPFEITHRGVRSAHRTLVQMNEKLAEINDELDGFSYTISHDLRAPLRHMQGFAQALLDDYAAQLDPVAQDYARRIVTASERMDALIRDLLTYSRLSRTEVELEPLSWGPVVEEILVQLDVELRERGAKVVVEQPVLRVLGHRLTLQQIFVNLINNAIKFVGPGIQPEIRMRDEDRDDRVRLWVEDNGIGIPPEEQESIFHVFRRLHSSEKYPGTGIGLSIVSKAAAKMGGSVGVESAPGKGSRFWVELRKAGEENRHGS